MARSIQVAVLIILIVGLIFLGGALPTRCAWRIWLVTGVIGGTIVLLSPEIYYDDRTLLYGVGEAAFMAAMLITLIGIVLRLILAGFVWPTLRAPSKLSLAEANYMRTADHVTECVLGICAGLFLTLGAALALRGAQGGLTLHLLVCGIAGLASIWVFRTFVGHARRAAGTALSIVAALAFLGGTVWPSMIRAKADGIMPGLPRCLRALDRPAANDETMLLTLPHGQLGSPGLILTVMTEHGARHFRWSYRANQFAQTGSYRFGDCPPLDIE